LSLQTLSVSIEVARLRHHVQYRLRNASGPETHAIAHPACFATR
jgi:hypothetical protein